MTTQIAAPVSDRTLPEPVDLSSDRGRAFHDLDVHGYCLIANALSLTEVKELKDRLVEVAAQEIADDTDYVYDDGCNQRVWVLLNKGECFVRLAQHPIGLELAGHVLAPAGEYDKLYNDALAGPHVLLDAIHANIAGPGGHAQARHRDDMACMIPQQGDFPVVVNVAWLLDDTTVENGATIVAPGSHHGGSNSLQGQPADDDTVAVCAPAGTAFCFEGRLWHGTGANITEDERRHVVFTTYTRPWLRTGENHFVSTDPKIVEEASPTLRRLVGYDAYAYRGTIGGFDRNAPRG